MCLLSLHRIASYLPAVEVLLLCTLEKPCSAEPPAVAVSAVAVVFLPASHVMASEFHAHITVIASTFLAILTRAVLGVSIFAALLDTIVPSR